MKKIVITSIAVLGIVLFSQAQVKKTPAKNVPVKATAKPNALIMKSLNDSFSYAVGLNIASNLKQQGVDVLNAKLVSLALDDALKGNPSALNSEDANRVIQTELMACNAKKQAADKKLAAVEIAKGRAFLNENKSKEGVVTLPNGLQYKIIKAGDPNGNKPTIQDTVVVNYRGTLIDGLEFDSSEKNGGPITFPVAGVIKGWTQILQLMTPGSKWEVFIPNELAYGERAMGHDIPAGAALIFDIDLLEVKPAATH